MRFWVIFFYKDSQLLTLENGAQQLFIITMEFLMLLDLKNLRKEWEVASREIKSVVQTEKGVSITRTVHQK